MFFDISGNSAHDKDDVYQYTPSGADFAMTETAPKVLSFQTKVPTGGMSSGASVSFESSPAQTQGISLGDFGVSSDFSGSGGITDAIGGMAGRAAVSALAANALGSNEGSVGSSWSCIDYTTGPALQYAQTLFDVTTEDVVRRLRVALLPYPLDRPLHEDNQFQERPDFWGPFWVATTVVLFLSATGNFARLIEEADPTRFKADYGLVSLAAFLVYGCLFLVPLGIRVLMYLSGSEADSVNFKHVVCAYGYSLAAAVPVSLLCLLPLDSTRWLAWLLGLGVSLAFIRRNLWNDIVVDVPWVRYTLMGLLTGGQAIIFTAYRVHFFRLST
jgi:hypothetical protein